MWDNSNNRKHNINSHLLNIIIGLCIAIVIFVGVGGIVYGFQYWKVFSAEQDGKAALAKAEQDRQIAVAEANAKKESAKLLAEAEIERAKGLAEANRIVADSLRGKDEYIHYLWIEALKESKDQVIYIPTEAGIPITESTRLTPKIPTNINGANNN